MTWPYPANGECVVSSLVYRRPLSGTSSQRPRPLRSVSRSWDGLAIRPTNGRHYRAPRLLHLRLPPLLVLPAPELRRLLVAVKVAVLGVAVQRPRRAVGDVAEVAQQRALVRFRDLTVELAALPDGIEEVDDVERVAGGALDLAHRLTLGVVDRVAAAANRQAALLADEHHIGDAVLRQLATAQALPG